MPSIRPQRFAQPGGRRVDGAFAAASFGSLPVAHHSPAPFWGAEDADLPRSFGLREAFTIENEPLTLSWSPPKHARVGLRATRSAHSAPDPRDRPEAYLEGLASTPEPPVRATRARRRERLPSCHHSASRDPRTETYPYELCEKPQGRLHAPFRRCSARAPRHRDLRASFRLPPSAPLETLRPRLEEGERCFRPTSAI